MAGTAASPSPEHPPCCAPAPGTQPHAEQTSPLPSLGLRMFSVTLMPDLSTWQAAPYYLRESQGPGRPGCLLRFLSLVSPHPTTVGGSGAGIPVPDFVGGAERDMSCTGLLTLVPEAEPSETWWLCGAAAHPRAPECASLMCSTSSWWALAWSRPRCGLPSTHSQCSTRVRFLSLVWGGGELHPSFWGCRCQVRAGPLCYALYLLGASWPSCRAAVLGSHGHRLPLGLWVPGPSNLGRESHLASGQ